MYDLGGQLVKQTTATYLDVSELPAGFYVIRTGNHIAKWVKQ
ncbi:MAG: T9SS type A sorting domain-containing protein [Saprospiraceae bacterium]